MTYISEEIHIDIYNLSENNEPSTGARELHGAKTELGQGKPKMDKTHLPYLDPDFYSLLSTSSIYTIPIVNAVTFMFFSRSEYNFECEKLSVHVGFDFNMKSA